MKIVLSVVLAMLLVGCSDEKNSQTNGQESKVAPVAKEAVKKEITKEVVSSTESEAEETTQKVEKVPVEEVKRVAEESVKKVEKKVDQTVATVQEATAVATATSSVDGVKLFRACSSCHGMQAEKKALGKSQIIKGWDKAKIITALHGYKEGTYGGAMKGAMKGQVAKLSDADIKALAEYISKL